MLPQHRSGPMRQPVATHGRACAPLGLWFQPRSAMDQDRRPPGHNAIGCIIQLRHHVHRHVDTPVRACVVLPRRPGARRHHLALAHLCAGDLSRPAGRPVRAAGTGPRRKPCCATWPCGTPPGSPRRLMRDPLAGQRGRAGRGGVSLRGRRLTPCSRSPTVRALRRARSASSSWLRLTACR
jgi:hypothetical protein